MMQIIFTKKEKKTGCERISLLWTEPESASNASSWTSQGLYKLHCKSSTLSFAEEKKRRGKLHLPEVREISNEEMQS